MLRMFNAKVIEYLDRGQDYGIIRFTAGNNTN